MSITLHGSPISNYYNKVKLALLEKDLPFAEVDAGVPGASTKDQAVLAASPLGKIPFLVTTGTWRSPRASCTAAPSSERRH